MSITSSELEKYKESLCFCDSESEEEFDNMNFKLVKYYIKKYKDKTDIDHEELKLLSKSINTLLNITSSLNNKINEKDLLINNLIERIETLESSIRELVKDEIKKFHPKNNKNNQILDEK